MYFKNVLFGRKGILLTFVWIVLHLLDVGKCESSDPKPNCKSNAHVCTTILKYPDGSEFDEGPYCLCDRCNSKWIENDYMSLAWPHHERAYEDRVSLIRLCRKSKERFANVVRKGIFGTFQKVENLTNNSVSDAFVADKTVLYKFCIPIIPMRECDDPGVPAITMGTETDEWSPHIRDARCACADHRYQLLAWYRHPLHRYDNTSGLWIYEYYCDKPECTINSYPCAKIYLDPHFNRKIIGYTFLCACPKGYKCPDYDEDEEEDPEKDTDKNGEFIPRYCEPVHKRIVQSTTSNPKELLS